MSLDDDKRMLEFLLGYEELDAERRREVDDYLAQHPGARERLEKLRELERRAVEPMGEIGLDTLEPLGAEDAAGEQKSREALLAKLGMGAGAPPRRRVRRGRRRAWRIWIPAAAAAAVLLALLGPWNASRMPESFDLQVVRLDDGRQTRSGTGGAQLRTGDAFALTFELGRETSVVVYHVDPRGEVSLVLPIAPDRPAPRFAAGPVQIPGRDDPEQWVLGGESGPESFVVGLGAGSVSSVSELDASLMEQLQSIEDRDERLRRIDAFLRSRLGAASLVEFDHRP